MYINFLNNVVFTALGKTTTFYRSLHRKQNHYEVLKLKQNCTGREIKRAYIELSKKYHPDRNNSTSPKLFLEVSEAYKVLSKPDTRQRYDVSLSPERFHADFYQQYPRRNPMDDPSFFRNRNRQYDSYYESKPYYGIRGVDRMSNSIILLACLVFMAVGVTIQFMAIKHSITFRREELLRKSTVANINLEKSRKTAEDNGNKLQLELLEQKFKKGGNTID